MGCEQYRNKTAHREQLSLFHIQTRGRDDHQKICILLGRQPSGNRMVQYYILGFVICFDPCLIVLPSVVSRSFIDRSVFCMLPRTAIGLQSSYDRALRISPDETRIYSGIANDWSASEFHSGYCTCELTTSI